MPTDLSRRAVIQQGSLILAGLSATRLLAAEPAQKPAVTFGLLTDVHYGDIDRRGNRYYRESLGKVREIVDHFNQRKPRFVTHLGDLVDSAPTLEQEIGHLRTINAELKKLTCDRHYVLGNHCVTAMTKAEFAENSGAGKPFYSFDAGGTHFVILDACYKQDGEPYGRSNFDWKDTMIPADELAWLSDDLAAAKAPVIVLAHQRLDLNDPDAHGVKNASKVRAIFEHSGKVRAVFQGHSHKNDYRTVSGIHYVTLVAVIEGTAPDNSGAALVCLYPDGSLKVEGFRRQQSHTF